MNRYNGLLVGDERHCTIVSVIALSLTAFWAFCSGMHSSAGPNRSSLRHHDKFVLRGLAGCMDVVKVLLLLLLDLVV